MLILLVGIWLGGHPGALPSPLRGAFFQDNPNRLEDQVLDTLLGQYYRPLTRSQLVDKGLSAMVASLNDPYSHYYSASAYQKFLNQTNQRFHGIGVDVVQDPRGLRVIDVFPGAPAARAGLQHGDLIVSVDSHGLAGHSSTYAQQLIRGPAGTTVQLSVLRGRQTLSFKIVRAEVVVPVTSRRIVHYRGLRIGYLRLASFTAGSGDALRRDVHKLLGQGAQALILDLRENGGGLLNEAVNVASIFIPDGTIVSTRGRSQPTQVYAAKRNAIAPKLPMAVLVDRDTASSAEIVTGALKDHGRAEVVGTRTYGKGVFQEIMPMPGGGALDITVGEYFTPNGQNLGGGGVREGRGIQPNVYAPNSFTNRIDHALQTAERVVAARVR